MSRSPGPLTLRLPASSANLGPGFDAVALALALYLEVDAEPAPDYAVSATGRHPDLCGALEGNLLLETYKDVAARYHSGPPVPLALTVRNGIPLGMGCGSSAASRLAGVALASHFGGLGWAPARMLDEAAALEGHPDNVAACCLGGFAVAAYAAGSSPEPARRVGNEPPRSNEPRKDPPQVRAISLAPPPPWHALLVLPAVSLATTASRAVLPASYARRDVAANLQAVALLTAAVSAGRGDLLAAATADRLHQPFRAEVCPLLPRLLPLAGQADILSVTLSGAGSGVLLLLASEAAVPSASALVRKAAEDSVPGLLEVAELLPCSLARGSFLFDFGT